MTAVMGSASSFAETETADPVYRSWIEGMKTSERGPFQRIRWFCRDGSVLPLTPDACDANGGGFQHGEWNERTVRLRSDGFFIANILAGAETEDRIDETDFPDRYAQLLIERFLVRADNGWILRQAQFYRGAIQEEDERAAGRSLLLELAGRDDWIGFRFPALRAGVGLLPHTRNTVSVDNIRRDSFWLSRRDPGFDVLRAKIHGSPGPEDAEAVRQYAASLDADKRWPYLTLAREIDAVYRAAPLHEDIRAMDERFAPVPWLQARIRAANARLRLGASPVQMFETCAYLLQDLRDALPRVDEPSVRLAVIRLGIRLERETFRISATVRDQLPGTSRRDQAALLALAARAAYGSGVINQRLLAELLEALQALDTDSIGLDRYRAVLAYLGLAPAWGSQALRMHFFDSMQKLAQIEPLAMLFIQDQLRGSPLLFYSTVLDGLSRDANRLAGVTHRLFERDVGIGLKALNPGLAYGALNVAPNRSGFADFKPDGIYVLPETVSDLPPVAGILTAGAGNPLSHVQMLARNLGVPNVNVSDERVNELAEHEGETIVLAVSHSGLVEIAPWSDDWKPVFDRVRENAGSLIDPDLDKLDLKVRDFIPLGALRSADSGRMVGPKAAQLGELHGLYPGKVSNGIAVPFGLFREYALNRPRPGHEGTVWDWMAERNRILAAMPDGDAQKARETEEFRAELYETILDTPLDNAFRKALETALESVFGDELPGLFVRSDTNVEDLPEFTGAGLNLTLPNVVGIDELMEAIPRVWASPFTARAFRWRQALMTRPEHVYTSVLLQELVASEKSGVLVTQDIENGDPGVISVAVNEGLAGAVKGQAAESLRISVDSGDVRVLAAATAPWRLVPDPAGGLKRLPSSGKLEVLEPEEIAQLIEFCKTLPEHFGPSVDDEGNPAPVDVEFGFVNGELRLFQLRPFLDSREAGATVYLQEMDRRLDGVHRVTVELDKAP